MLRPCTKFLWAIIELSTTSCDVNNKLRANMTEKLEWLACAFFVSPFFFSISIVVVVCGVPVLLSFHYPI